MHISILTLFPDMFEGPLTQSILKRAQEKNIITISYINIRDFARDSYGSVDGHTYGGGTGMVMRVDVIDEAIQEAKKRFKKNHPEKDTPAEMSILLDAGGETYKQQTAQELSTLDHIILVCGHYEGVDDRVRTLVDKEISIGDYVLTGGEIPAMVVVDSVTRLIPGVLAKADATMHESFTQPLLEYPQFTEPRCYKNMDVPPILLSGNHAAIKAWREKEALQKTQKKRPDLVSDTTR